MNLTHKEHLKWWVGDKLFGARDNFLQPFKLELGKCQGRLMPWKDEFDLAINKLVADHGSNLSLFYSGGSDSELVLDALVERGVNLSVHTIKFTSGANSHETDWAENYCYNHNRIRYYVHMFELERYVRERKYLDLGVRYQCSQIAYLVLMEHFHLIDTPIILGGEVFIQKRVVDDPSVNAKADWVYVYNENEDGVTYRYTHANKHPVINEVFTYTPELLASWLASPKVQEVVQGKVPGKLSMLSSKLAAYEHELGRKLRARQKFTGYEKHMFSNMAVMRDIERHIPKSQTAFLDVKDLLVNLTGDDR